MRLSLAPIYPSGTRPVAAAGAGVHFATSPNGERSGVRRKGGLVAFDFHGAARLDMTGRCVAGHGSTSHPRHGWQFSGLAIASLGWARQCSAGRGNSATRGDIAGQFSRGVACQDTARLVPAKRELGAESKRNFTRPCVARRGGSGPGAAWLHATQSGIWDNLPRRRVAVPGGAWQVYTSPGTAIPDIFPSTKKHPHHAGQRSTG